MEVVWKARSIADMGEGILRTENQHLAALV